MRVLAALSGGVDSAVAAARAVDAGHDVTAVHLALSPKPLAFREGARGCCSLEDSRDARRAADVLGVPFYVWDVAEEFRAAVVDDFVAEYEAGRTPNPCLRCNEQIKFSAVLDRAIALGFDAVATGHYARLVVRADGGRELHRAVDDGKDQSYVLAVVPPERLAHAMFPLGESLKPDVRAEAARRGLAVADKPDSHDICFVPDGDTAGFLRERLGELPGDVVDTDGTVVGAHDGTYAFTVGQRRGLRLGVPAADGRPRYVLDVSPVSRAVTVGPAEALDVDGITGDSLVVLAPDVVSDAAVDGTELDDVTVQVRAHGAPVPARVRVDAAGRTLRAELAEPVRGVAPGQAAVVYAGTRVVASATIGRSGRKPGP